MSAASRARVGRGAEGREGEGEGHDCGLARMPEHASRTAEDSDYYYNTRVLPTANSVSLLSSLYARQRGLRTVCVMCTRTVGLRPQADAGTGAYHRDVWRR